MSNFFSENFRQNSRRLKGYDYSSSGIYFVTITTDAQILFFGKIIDKRICLSPAGKIVYNNWVQIPKKFPHIILDKFVIMPDHMHGILIINDIKSNRLKIFSKQIEVILSKSNNRKGGGITGEKNPMISQNSLSYVLRWFKARSTYEIRKTFPQLSFAWQSRFHDRIITDDKSLYIARKYIRNNPKRKS